MLNMSFDGGYLPAVSPNLPQPLGWNSTGASNNQPCTITAFSIASKIVTFTCANNLVGGVWVSVDGLSTGTYLNGLQFLVLSATATQFTVGFNYSDTALTTDSGTVQVTTSAVGLIASSEFGNSLLIQNTGNSAWQNTTVLFQGAYQDAYYVPIIAANTAYSVRIKARALNVDGQEISVGFSAYSNGTFYAPGYGTATLTFNQGALQTLTAPVILTGGIPTIPTTMVFQLSVVNLAVNAAIEIDRIELFPTDRPVDTTTVWCSYVDNFEAVDGVTGSLSVGGDNPQAAQGAYEILEQLYIEKTGSFCVTQDSPNYEPNQWTVKTITGSGSLGPNAFDEGEEWSLKASRNGIFFFDGGKAEPISRELQAVGVNGSVWETINWSAGNTIWLRNDLLNRRFYVGVPMITPNVWLPKAKASVPTSPNVILMCNYTGCPTAEELMVSAPIHTTMFGDVKSLDMRRKWSLWQIPCPVAEFILRPGMTTEQFLLCNGIASSKIYQFANGAASGGQNTDDGAMIDWDYVTYGFMGAKQGQQNPMIGAARKLWTYLTVRIEGSGKVPGKLYPNTLGAPYPFTIPYPFSLASPAQNDQERVIEIGAQRLFVEFYPIGSGGYAEICCVALDGEADPWAARRGVAS
jgi:hypothetical protein